MDEEWVLLLSFLPENWRELAAATGALKGLRKDKAVEDLLRTLLLHLGCGHSLRETVVRAKKAQLADLSDVALLKRLKKAKAWLYALCVELFRERGIEVSGRDGFQVRAFDATTVKEPGKTGALWRLHYSVRLPSLTCDFFKLTETQGQGTGESLTQFPINPGDYILADRGYSTATGIAHVRSQQAYLTVRLNTGSLPLHTVDGHDFDLTSALVTVKRAGAVKTWPVAVIVDTSLIPGRVCVLRKTEEATKLAHEKLRLTATRKGKQLKPHTLEYAKYVILFTVFPESEFLPAGVLEWYRIRWQVELVFKRFKSLAQLGHLPKYDEESAKAWLYGKLLVALLVEKLISYATAISPWGYHLEKSPAP